MMLEMVGKDMLPAQRERKGSWATDVGGFDAGC